MRITLLFFVISLMAACISISKTDLPSGIIKAVSLNKEMTLESRAYAIEKCNHNTSDGQITIQRKNLYSQTFSFCVNEQSLVSEYSIEISSNKNEVCHIKESGNCDNGICYSVAIKEQCFELNN